MAKTESKFKRVVEFSPAYDQRDENPNKNYGIGSVRIKFALVGEKGAVQVLLGTDWYLPETVAEYRLIGNKHKTPPKDIRKDFDGKDKMLTCWDVGYHAKKPRYKGQTTMGKCEYLNGKPCYYDGSSLRGEEDGVPRILLEKGSDGIWEYLEAYYKQVFG